MTSSNGNIFRVTGLLCGEFAGHRWIPFTTASDAELWFFFFDLRLNQRLSKPSSRSQWFETPSHSLWHHCYVIRQSVIRFGISKPVGNVTGWLGRSRRTLLYTPSPEAFELSVGYETWPPIGFLWLACREMGWNRLSYNGLRTHVTHDNFRRFFIDHWPLALGVAKPLRSNEQSSCTTLTGGKRKENVK